MCPSVPVFLTTDKRQGYNGGTMKKTSLKLAAIGVAMLLAGAGCAKQPGELTINQEPLEQKAPQSTSYPITINPDGVTPKELTIAVGDTVEFRNSDVKPHWLASNPHPAHTDYSEFDPKTALAPGGIWTFKFDKAGTWKFHDHLNGRNLQFQGTIIVK